jgi:hypothetical protein
MMSYRQPLTKLMLDDLGIDASDVRAGGNYYEVVDLAIPVKETKCELVVGDTLEEKVADLAARVLKVTQAM